MLQKKQKMKEKIQLIDGIFSHLDNVPWETPANTLDTLYYSRSAEKYISPLVENVQDDTKQLTEFALNNLGASIMAVYGFKWSRLFETLHANYDPIENYSMIENGTENATTENTRRKTGTDTASATGTDTVTHTGSGSSRDSGQDTTGRTGTDTHTLSGTDTENITGSERLTKTGTVVNEDVKTEQHNIFGFNTTDTAGVPDSITTTNDRNTQTNNTVDDTATTGSKTTQYGRTDTETVALTDTLTHGKQTDITDNFTDSTQHGRTDTTTHNTTDAVNGTADKEHTLTRHGNIGVTTTQEMITQELILRETNYFLDVVFPDVDNLLCLKVY